MLIVSGQYTVQQVVSCSEWTSEVFKENYLPYDHDWNSLFTNIYINEFLGATYIWNFCLKIYVHINIASKHSSTCNIIVKILENTWKYIDQCLDMIKPLRVWGPDPDQNNTLNFLTLFITKATADLPTSQRQKMWYSEPRAGRSSEI